MNPKLAEMQKDKYDKVIGQPSLHTFESKGGLAVNVLNQIGACLGFNDPKRKKIILGVLAVFFCGMVYMGMANPDPKTVAQQTQTSYVSNSQPSDDDAQRFMEPEPDETEITELKKEADTKEIASEPIKTEVPAAPVEEKDPEPSSIFVYTNPAAAPVAGAEDGSISSQAEEFVPAKLLSDTKTLGSGGLAIAKGDDGTLYYGNAYSDITGRMKITFTEGYTPSGAHTAGLHLVALDKNKAQGIEAKCTQHNKGNLIGRGAAIVLGTASAYAGRSSGAYSGQDAARDRLADQLSYEATVQDSRAQLAYLTCTLPAGTEMFLLATKGAGGQ